MALHLGDIAPDFTARTTQGTIRFHDWLGTSWGLLLSHPKDFTPVCTTELGAVARLADEFSRRNVKVIAVSVDDLATHFEWIRDINATQHTSVDLPIIADEDRRVVDLYGMLYGLVECEAHDNATVRSAFIVGPDKRIKLIVCYPESTGRNFREILRAIDSLQLAAQHGVVTPADWKRGDDCLIDPQMPADEITRRFRGGVAEVRPYLRYTPQPNPVAG
jgi:alkyl hydroperoxide reductase subunit AhpC